MVVAPMPSATVTNAPKLRREMIGGSGAPRRNPKD